MMAMNNGGSSRCANLNVTNDIDSDADIKIENGTVNVTFTPVGIPNGENLTSCIIQVQDHSGESPTDGQNSVDVPVPTFTHTILHKEYTCNAS
jgi:hypothetical protein